MCSFAERLLFCFSVSFLIRFLFAKRGFMFYGAIKRRLGDNKLAAAVVDSAVIYGY